MVERTKWAWQRGIRAYSAETFGRITEFEARSYTFQQVTLLKTCNRLYNLQHQQSSHPLLLQDKNTPNRLYINYQLDALIIIYS